MIKGETSMETDSTDKDPLSKNEMTYLCAFCHFIFQTKSGYMEHTKLGNCVQVSFCACPSIYTTIGIVRCTFDLGIVTITTKPYILQKIWNQ